jgi:ion channel POLLUX/CASTOR
VNLGLTKFNTFRQKLRYWFDNSLSRKGAFPFWVGVAVATGALAIATTQAIVFAIPVLQTPVPEATNPFEAFWFSLGKMLSLGGAATYGDRIMAVIYWFAGLTVMGSIFAFRTVALNNTIARMKAAPSPILDKGHILILGWSPRIFTILKELSIANENQHKPKVVVFANESRVVMDAEIALRAPNLGNLQVITRKGDTTNPIDLVRANVAGARSVIVLDSDRSGDSMIVATVLAAKSISDNPNQRFIAEVDDPNTAEALESSTAGQALAVIPRDVIAKVTAQASRQPGIPAVILELLDFDGDEIYFTEVAELTGKTYFEAQISFQSSAIIGIVPLGKDPVLNPPHNYEIQKGDQLIAIAEDDDKVLYTGAQEGIKRPKAPSTKRTPEKPRNLLVIGWSAMGESVLRELAEFLPKGSTADVVSQERFTEELLERQTSFGDLKVNHIKSTGTFDQLKELVIKKRYDEVLVLGYRGEKVTEAEADGQTLLATMQLTRLFQTELASGTAPRLVAEILDPLKARLAQTSSVDDLVVSENLAALLVAQLSENPKLASIFKDLFSPSKGSAVHVRPIADYAKPGKSISFAELIAAASAQGETAIGWRVKSETSLAHEVVVNPTKDKAITPGESDGLIVIGRPV